jgi:hypothetical protein
MAQTFIQFSRQTDPLPLTWQGFAKTAKVFFLLPLICLLFSTESFASHYRYGNITWESLGGNTVRFNVKQAYRMSYFSGVSVGAVINTEAFYFGDGGSTSVQLVVTSVNPAEDWFFGEFVTTHTYASSGNRTAYYENGNRLSGLQNNGDGSYRAETIVNVGTGNSSPVILSPVILNMQVGQNTANFQVPANDPNGDNIRYRLTNSTEMAGGTNPSGLSVSTTGLLSFNTVGLTIGHLYSAGVVVEDLDGSNNVKSKSMVDLIIKIVGNSTPPVFNAPTPAEGTILTATCGTPVTFDVNVSSGGTVTLTAVGVPSGASFTNSLPASGNPVTTTFNWTPSANQTGSIIIVLIAENNDGVQSTRSITIQVGGSADNDNDGYTQCQGDCDDNNAAVYPGAPENFSNGIDDNCDGFVDVVPACIPTITYPCQSMWITNVTLANLNNTTICSSGGYGNYTAQSADVNAGGTYSISVTGGSTGSGYNQHTRVYVDWNRDGDFNDAGEMVVSALLTYYYQANSATFAIPVGTSGNYLMRVISEFVGDPNPTYPTSCSSTYGEAEDYVLDVNPCVVPSFTACPAAPITTNTGAGVCSAVVNYTATADGLPTPTYTYAFSGATSGSGSGTGSGAAFEKGTTTVTVTATNDCGAPVCSFTVTVLDNQNPSITCPNNINRSADPNQCSAVVAYSGPTFSDNCPGAFLTLTSPANTASGSVFPVGTSTVVNWKVTDAVGKTNVCQFSITVNDTQAPTITCPANIVRSNDAGQCYATVTYTTPTAADNCGTVTVARTSAANTASGSQFPKGTTVVTWEASDVASPANTKSCSFTVTVNDTQLPSIACPSNQSIGTTPTLCTGIATFATPTASDNCALPANAVMQTTGPASGSAFPKGQTVVTFRVTDAAGLTKTCTFRVTVNDTENPVITCPTSQSVNTTANACASAPLTYSTPTATDNCPGTISVLRIGGPASGSTFSLGTTNITWRAVDGSGRSSTCSFSVTVTDVTPPSITCPPNLSVTGSGSPCTGVATYAMPTATDNCSGTLTPLLQGGLNSGSVFQAGVTVNTWRAIAGNGQSSTCSFTVTVSCGTSSEQVAMNLAPNPATADVIVTVAGMDEKGGDLIILDAQGHIVWQQRQVQSPTSNINLSDVPPGLYFVTLRSAGTVVTKRLMKVK